MRNAFIGLTIGALATVGLASTAAIAQTNLTIGTFPPGSMQFIVHNAIAQAANKYVDGVNVELSSTGAATEHMVQVAAGELDFSLTSLVAMRQIQSATGPFRNLTDGPATAGKLSILMSHPGGARHVIVRADSGMESLGDIAGKRVFLGPPGGVATNIMTVIVKAQTGMTAEAGDFEQILVGWGPAIQGFQDGQIDVLAIPGIVPDARIMQIAQTTEIKLIGLDAAKMTENPATAGMLRNPMNDLVEVAANAYGSNQKNTGPVSLIAATVNVAVRTDLDEDLVYNITKAFWENISDNFGSSPWFEAEITAENAVALIPGDLHPGARRYYEEVGLTISNPLPLSQ